MHCPPLITLFNHTPPVIMKTQLCSLLFVFGLSATQAQKAPDLSPAAQRLTEAYTALQQSPTDTARQKAFSKPPEDVF